MFKSVFTAIAIVLATMTAAFADDAKMVRSIAITGHGEVRGVPDMATITMGVISSADTARAALDANTKTMQDLMTLLKQSGLEDRDIATSNFSVNPRYDYGKAGTEPPKVVGYDVSNTVTVAARKISMLGELLDKAVSAGSNQIHGIAFSFSKPDAMLDEARKLAVADARRRAEIYATATGIALGDIISISENAGFQPPVPMFARAEKSAAAADVPIAQGEQALSIDVSIVWAIK